MWLVVDPVTGNVHTMEHEGDYNIGDLLVQVSYVNGVVVRVMPTKEDE